MRWRGHSPTYKVETFCPHTMAVSYLKYKDDGKTCLLEAIYKEGYVGDGRRKVGPYGNLRLSLTIIEKGRRETIKDIFRLERNDIFDWDSLVRVDEKGEPIFGLSRVILYIRKKAVVDKTGDFLHRLIEE